MADWDDESPSYRTLESVFSLTFESEFIECMLSYDAYKSWWIIQLLMNTQLFNSNE